MWITAYSVIISTTKFSTSMGPKKYFSSEKILNVIETGFGIIFSPWFYFGSLVEPCLRFSQWSFFHNTSLCWDARCSINCRAAASSSELHGKTNRWQLLLAPPAARRPQISCRRTLSPPGTLSVQFQVRTWERTCLLADCTQWLFCLFFISPVLFCFWRYLNILWIYIMYGCPHISERIIFKTLTY